MYFGFDLSALSVALFCVGILSALYVIIFYLRAPRRVCRHARVCGEKEDDSDPYVLPKVSVVVYAQDDSYGLEATLQSILSQQYEPGFEVIVVNEGSSDNTRQTVGLLQVSHPNLYLTFTPDGARNLSRKKLAVTIGVKAAHSDVVLITDASTVARSPRWLHSMMRHFADDQVGVVLGCSAPDAEADSGMWRRTRAFDYVSGSVTWLSAAIGAKAYRGCGSNVAYRRQLFFDNKGFSSALNLRHGDDDIFINEITTPDNTAVEIGSDAITQWVMRDSRRQMRDKRLALRFTGRRVPAGARKAAAFGQWMLWVMCAALVGGAMEAGCRNLFGWALAAVVAIATFVTVSVTWRKAMVALRSRKMFLTLPFLVMTAPLRNILLGLRSRFGKFKRYTWD